MPAEQTVWVTGLLILPLLALFGFMRRRRRAVDYVENRAVKARLPWWVKSIEILLMLGFGYLWAAAGYELYAPLNASNPEMHGPLTDAAAVYVIIGFGFVTLPMAMLSANAVSWLMPFLRNANQEAFRGTHVSFKSANAGLIKLASVSVPFGMVALLVAAIKPWTS